MTIFGRTMAAVPFISAGLLALALPASAQDMSSFQAGPVFQDIGLHAPVEGAAKIPAETKFPIAFDVADAAEGGQRSRSIDSAARFINMHVAAGVPQKNIRIAVVVHGKAAHDLLNDAAWAAKGHEGPNPSGAMIAQMHKQGVRFILCGQTSVAQNIKPDDLIPGVEIALSAMTAHALLQQGGYTVNPF